MDATEIESTKTKIKFESKSQHTGAVADISID